MITDWETFMIDYMDEYLFDVYSKDNKHADVPVLPLIIKGKIVESIELPNKDIIVGIESNNVIGYYNLNEIFLLREKKQEKSK